MRGFYPKNSEAGFTLVELAIVIMIVGLLLGGSMALLKPYVESAQRNASITKMNNIADSLAMFAQQYGRLPCPGDPNPATEPYGSPRNSGAAGDNFTQPCQVGPVVAGNYVGIIPFRALGLTEDNVRDGYGNLFTYAVSPILAGNNTTSANLSQIHAQCRTAAWIDATVPVNRNPRKAAMCCPANDTFDIILNDSNTAPINAMFATNNHEATPPGTGPATDTYSDANNQYIVPPAPALPATNRLVAFVLVSHGKNGDGAFIAQSPNVNPVTADPAAQESENRNNDLTFVWRPLTKVDDATYFDDLMVWRTNDQVISEFGNSSCIRP